MIDVHPVVGARGIVRPDDDYFYVSKMLDLWYFARGEYGQYRNVSKVSDYIVIDHPLPMMMFSSRKVRTR